MSDGDVDTSSRSCDETSIESSMVSKPQTSSGPLSCTSKTSSSPIMGNFLDYDPPSHTSDDTIYASFTYFVSRSIGLGFLCLPYAFKQVGVITGLALCLIAGLMFTYTFTTLCRFRYKLCQIHRVPTVPYQNLIEYSLACGPRVVCRWFSTFLRFTFIATNLTLYFGKSCLYTKFVSLTIYELLTEMGFSVNYFNVSLSFDVVCLVFLLFPNSSYLAPLHFLSNIACTGLLSLIVYNIFTSDMNIDSQTLICGNWTDVFQFFGILLFTFIPVVQVFKIEDGLIRNDHPAYRAWPKLLNMSMMLVTNMYIAIGLCGYLDQQDVPIFGIPILKYLPAIRCRTIVKSCVAVNVTIFHRELNLESTLLWVSSIKVDNEKSGGKTSQPPSKTVKYSPAVFSGMTAFTKILFTFCSFLVTIAVASPATSGFQVIVALIGYLGNACNMMIYPYIVEMCVTYALHGISTRRYVIFKDVCLVFLGLSVFAFGTSALVHTYRRASIRTCSPEHSQRHFALFGTVIDRFYYPSIRFAVKNSSSSSSYVTISTDPAPAAGTSICSQKLSSPNRPADRLTACLAPERTLGAGFTDAGSISVAAVVLRQRPTSKLVLHLADPDPGPVKAAAAAAACRSDRRRAPPRALPAWVGRFIVVVHLAPSSRPHENPPAGVAGGRQASRSDSPPQNVLSPTFVQYVYQPDVPCIQPAVLGYSY